jgi:hypothetical protein
MSTFEQRYGRKIRIGCYQHHAHIEVNTSDEMEKFYKEHRKCQVY